MENISEVSLILCGFSSNWANSLIDGITGKPGTVHKNEILAKVSAQKILINLGDLSRYKEQIEMTGSFRQAREYYEQAQQLLPTNGKPYNQLAILSIYLVSSQLYQLDVGYHFFLILEKKIWRYILSYAELTGIKSNTFSERKFESIIWWNSEEGNIFF